MTVRGVRSVAAVGTECIGLPAGLVGGAVADLQPPRVVLGGAAHRPGTANLGEDSRQQNFESVGQGGYDNTAYDSPFAELRAAGAGAEIADAADHLIVLATHCSVIAEMDQQWAPTQAARETPRILWP